MFSIASSWSRSVREKYKFVHVYELCDVNKFVNTSFTNSYTFIENRNRHFNLMIGIEIFHSAFGLLPLRVFGSGMFILAVSTNHQIIKVRSQYNIKSLTELMNAEFLWKNSRFLCYFDSFMMNNSFTTDHQLIKVKYQQLVPLIWGRSSI